MSKKPFELRTDLEKCKSQWTKLQGLHTRTEWSAAIVRAATAAEIATNYAIRAEFAQRSTLSADFVDSLLKWSNGLRDKLDHILVPLTKGSHNAKEIKNLKGLAYTINDNRNDIVHRGEFRDEPEATEAIAKTRQFIEGLVRLYEATFELPTKNATSSNARKAAATNSAALSSATTTHGIRGSR